MKKSFRILIASVIIMTACVSCNKEKVEDEKLPNLVGTWTGETISIWGGSLGTTTLTFTESILNVITEDGTTISKPYSVKKSVTSYSYYFTFGADNEADQSTHFFNISEDKNTLYINNGNSSFSLNGTYTKQHPNINKKEPLVSGSF